MNEEMVKLLKEFTSHVIEDFFTCPDCGNVGGISAETENICPFNISCHCRCGHNWTVEQ